MSESGTGTVAQTVGVAVPEVGDMSELVLLAWLCDDAAHVEEGQPIAEMETDKATLEVEAPAAGWLLQLAASGESIPVGANLALIGDSLDEMRSEALPASASGNHSENGQGASPEPAAATRPDPSSTEPPPRHAASPSARRLARGLGIDLATVAGRGRAGRILRADVLDAAGVEDSPAAINSASANKARAASNGQQPSAAVPDHAPAPVPVELSRLQMTVARRMVQVQTSVPDFAATIEVDAGPAVSLRAEIKDAGVDPLPSVNDMVVAACAQALGRHPKANAAFRDTYIDLYQQINVGIAVASDDGLVVPTVFNANQKTLREIASTTRALVEKARLGQLTQPEMDGGTFTVSNLGMFGVTSFTAVINQPQSAILAVGAVTARPVVKNDAITIGHTMSLTLSSDHRVLYGADAAKFLAEIRDLLEHPLRLMS